MILGPHWFYKRPEGIYPFSYFEFVPGIGGHANDCAEIVCTYATTHGAQIKHAISELVERFPYASCQLKEAEQVQSICIFGYCLYDYDFLFATELEKLLQELGATKTQAKLPRTAEVQNFKGAQRQHSYYSLNKELTYVTTAPLPHLFNAAITSVSCTLSLPSGRLDRFISASRAASGSWNFGYLAVDVKSYRDQSYCSIVATNDRQGLAFQPYRFNDLEKYERELVALIDSVGGTFGIDSTSYNDYMKKAPLGPGTTSHVLCGDPGLFRG